MRVIYKPIAGIRELWDFAADSLPIREVWTYRIDQVLGLDLVPETALADGPFGHGAVQRFVHAEADEHVVAMINSRDRRVWPVAVLDAIVNNADRKAGHILRDSSDRLWAIDHGLTFHPDDKLRTVLWGFAGEPIPADLLERLGGLERALQGGLGREVAADLGARELGALRARVSNLIATGRHPAAPHDRPALPWPPY